MKSNNRYRLKLFLVLFACFVLPQIIMLVLFVILCFLAQTYNNTTLSIAMICASLIDIALVAILTFVAFSMSGIIAKPVVNLLKEFDAVFSEKEKFALEKTAQGLRYRLLVNNIKYFREKRIESDMLKQKLAESNAALSCTNDITWRVVAGTDTFLLTIPEYWYSNYPKFFLNKSVYLFDYIHDSDLIKFNSAMTRVSAVAERSFALKLQLKISADQTIWAIVKGTSIKCEDEIIIVGSIIDIQQKLQLEDEIRQNYLKYKFALNAVTDILYEVNVNSDEFIITDTDKWYAIFDIPLDGSHFNKSRRVFWEKIHPDYREGFVDRFLCYDHLLVLPNHSQTYEYRVMDKNGDWIWLSHTVTAVATENGHVSHVIGQMSNINDKKRRELREIYNSTHDSLTGAFSYSALRKEFDSHVINQPELIMIAVNINKFKQINDIFGHSTGDLALRHLVNILWKSQLTDCSVGRTGADEFIMLINEPQKYDDVQNKTIEMIFSLTANPVILDNNSIYLTVRVGASVYGKDGKTYDELYEKAVERMSSNFSRAAESCENRELSSK